MARRQRLLINVLLVSALAAGMWSVTGPAYADSDDGDCSGADAWFGGPSVRGSTDGTEVDVTGRLHRHRPGNGASPGRPATGTGGASSGRPLSDDELETLAEDLCLTSVGCDDRVSGTEGRPLDPEPGDEAVAVTIADLARFLPAVAGLHAEPDEWAVVGVPANFWVDVTPVTVVGELLGQPADVRFTPQAYRFDYGDGTVRTAAEAGRSWAALGQEELTATPTSHVYEDRGDLRATVTVVWSAEYRFADGPWTAVAGAVSGATPPQRVLVVVERTALTAVTTRG